MTIILTVTGVVAAVLVLVVASLAYLSLTARRPADLGLHDGRLRPCPSSPNCVSSQAKDDSRRVEPLGFEGSGEQAWRRLRQVLEGMDRVEIITDTGRYLHAEFTMPLFRFRDDVEFQLRPEASVIDLRSASRVGWYDLGVNRSRAQKLAEAWRAERPGASR
ncbi:MAG: DUF1499 domain-containing protein [Phycisphaerae bacterium]